MVTKALSNQHLWPKSFCRFPLNYLQSFHCFVYTPFYFYSYSRQVIYFFLFVCFLLSQYGNLQTRESPSPLFSLWHCCFCIWFFWCLFLERLVGHTVVTNNTVWARSVKFSERLMCMCRHFWWLKTVLKPVSFKDALTIQWLLSYKHSFKQRSSFLILM